MALPEVEANTCTSAETCHACFEDHLHPTTAGLYCPSGEHFVCKNCFSGWVRSESSPADGHVPKSPGQIWCMCKADVRSNSGCASDRPFTDQEIKDIVPEATLQAYTQACNRVREAQEIAKLPQGLNTIRIAPGAAEGSTCGHAPDRDRDIWPARMQIIEEVLTLRCPRCKAAFLDFDGCLALTCARGSCNARFCGVCLRDCGDETGAHAHVRDSCKYKQGSEMHAHGEALRGMQNRWRTERLAEMLVHLEAGRRARVVESLRTELQDLGLDADSFK